MEGSTQTQEPDPGAAKQTKPPSGTEYVVLMEVDGTLLLPSPEGEEPRQSEALRVWIEVGEGAEVPQRSHRRTAIAPALESAKLKLEPGMRFRVLDEDAATVIVTREKPPTTPSVEFVAE